MLEQSGTAEIKEVAVSSCSEDLKVGDIPGNTSYEVYVYQAVTDGTVEVSWRIGQEWNMEESTVSEVVKTYAVSEEGANIEEIPDVEPVSGDCTADGVFNIADVVMLQKYLACAGKMTD